MQILNIVLIVCFSSLILGDNSCIFKHPTQGFINLTSIGLRNGQPRFPDYQPSSSPGYTYSFNPCFPFMENGCQNAAVCQTTIDQQYSFTLATQNSAKWTVDSNMKPTLTYTYGSKTVSISMICSDNVIDAFEALGEDYVNHYSMRLWSRCACWNGCSNSTPSTTRTTSRPSPATTTHTIYSSSCRYKDSRYGTIDLSSIGNLNGDATFKDVYSNNYFWSYNPCYTFSEENCINVAGCQIDRTRQISYDIGLQRNAYWINMNKTNNLIPSIVYPSSSMNRRLTVQLICDRSLSSDHLKVLDEVSPGEYVMQLTSRCACWDGCIEPKPFPNNWDFYMIMGIAAGVVFVIFLIMMTCLFCSKPKQRYPVMIVNEKTPIFKSAY
ncbi:unnamed protein product [Adineta steineri]|uniref:MRH domain-containing protein n=1 Tax=Adineta steineri TaxID=433720 RepID=A0A819SRA2_9BILA|nr:unnamed protein product [Adineta steineri]